MASFDAQQVGRGIRRLLVGVVLLGVVIFVGCSTTTRVDAGHVGIRVKLAGSDRGVQDMPVVTGWVVLQPAHRADRPLPDERAERRVDAIAARGQAVRRVDHLLLAARA